MPKMLNAKSKLLTFLIVFLLAGGAVHQVVYSQDTPPEETQDEDPDGNGLTEEEEDDLKDEIEELTKKLEDTQNKGKSLQNEIDYMDTQISLTQTKIRSTNAKINDAIKKIEKLKGEIQNLIVRIQDLGTKIMHLEGVYGERKRAHYKTDGTTPNSVEFLLFLLEPFELDKKIQKAQYSEVMQGRDKDLLDEMNKARKDASALKAQQEDLKAQEEANRKEVERQKADLLTYQANLDSQKKDKQKLLEDTQNSEAKYQELLEAAQKQLTGFQSFVSSAGGGVIAANGFGEGEEGWYMSQRDARWAGEKIGRSNENVFDVGCLITAVAMVGKKYGSNLDPGDIANDNSRFFSTTAMMLIPWKGPSGKAYTSISVSQIDSELANGRPVIVGVYYGQFGTHFVVLSGKSGTDWITYDPYYGPDLKFSLRYSKNSIFQAVVFK